MASSSHNNPNIDPSLQDLGEQLFGFGPSNLDPNAVFSQNPPPPYPYPPNQPQPQGPQPQYHQPVPSPQCPPPAPYCAHSSGASSTTPTAAYTSSAQEIQLDVEAPSQETAGASGGTPSSAAKKRKAPPKYNADWWRFYEKTLNTDGGLVSGKCKVKNCKAEYFYSIANGLNSFRRHAEKHIKDKEEPQEHADPRAVQTVINPDGSRTHQRYDEKRMLNEFARYVAHKEQPISMGSCLGFSRLIIRGCGQPLFKRLHYRKVTKELKHQFTEMKNILLSIFATAPFKVALTSDIWTAGKHNLAYACITAHYLDDNWLLQKRIISFRTLEYPHTAEVIHQSIMGVLREFNLKNDLASKVFSISFDNASNNNRAVEYLIRSLTPILDGKYFHQKCACHILNLTVRAGIQTDEVQNLIKRFKDSLHFIFSHSLIRQEFHSLCERLSLRKLRVPWDVDTCWNSTFRMLKRCLPYRNVINETLSRRPEGLPMVVTAGEWAQLEKLMGFLEVFFTATLRLSCSYEPTAHELLHHLYYISKVYVEMQGTYL